jgi:hypothetical protein
MDHRAALVVIASLLACVDSINWKSNWLPHGSTGEVCPVDGSLYDLNGRGCHFFKYG